MTHETARELLLDLAYGELAPAEAREVEAHLAGCEPCRAERDRIAGTRALMRALPGEEPPAGEGILLAAARQAAERPKRTPLFSWVRLATTAAVLMVVGGVTLELLRARRVAYVEEWRAEQAPAAPALVLEATPPASPEAAAKRGPAPAAPAAPYALPPPPREDAPAPPRARGERPSRAAQPPGPPLARGQGEPPPAARDLAAPSPAASRSQTARRPEAAPATAGAVAAQGPAAADLGDLGSAPSSAPGVGAEAARRADRAEEREGALPGRKLARGEAGPAESARPAALAAGKAEAGPAHPRPALVEEITGLRDRGLLHEARRRPEPCPGGDSERVAWLDGLGAARRFARTGPLPAGMGAGEATRDQWYDAEGRLRWAVVEGSGPAGRFRRWLTLDAAGAVTSEDPADAPWPRADLTLRDPASAFWGPQRCAAAGR